MSFNSVYTHNPSPLGPLPTSIFGRQATTTYTSSLNNTSPTTSTSPYYHQIQNPPLAVLEHHSQQNMAHKGTTQWYPGSTSAMMSSSFAPYQSSNGSMHSIAGMDDKKPIYSMSGHQGSALAPTLPPPNHDINAAGMVGSRAPTRQLTNSKRAAQNRAAQRAFRQRKDRYIKDLEAKAKELEATKKQVEALQKDKVELQTIIRNLRNENAKLKGEEVMDEEGRHNGNNTGAGSNSNYSHYNSARNDESPVLDDEPWLRHKESVRNKEALSRPGSGLTDNPPRGSGIVLPPGPNTDSSVDPYFRPEYHRHTNSNSPSPPSSNGSSDRNRGSYGGSQNTNTNGRTEYSSSNEEDTDRVYDDLCELLKTRSRPSLPQNIGMNIWPQQQQQHSNQNVVDTASGSGTVVG